MIVPHALGDLMSMLADLFRPIRRQQFLRLLMASPFASLGGLTDRRPEPPVTFSPVPFDPSTSHERDFRPSGSLTRLSENLYLFEDCCNVYIVKQGRSAALVDFGSGDVLRVLPSIGVEKVDRVLVTHHHRDQVQGLTDMQQRPFPVVVPRAEARFFENVESFWAGVQIYINYDLRSHWNTPRHSIEVRQAVGSGDIVKSDGIDFRVLDTPGHTGGSVSYSAVVDGRRIVFCGDLIADKGKVHNWYDLHWDYYGFTQGMDASDQSFAKIRAENPDRLLPSHGPVIEKPDAAMRENTRRYAVLREMLVPNHGGRNRGEMRSILPHLIHLGGPPQQSKGGMTSYLILADSGNALLYDFGYVDQEHFQTVKEKLGIKHVTVTFSHYHDDHIIRAYELFRGGDTDLWVFENMADILENPTRYRLPCLVPFPIRPSRVIRDGERIQWEGFNLQFFHMPGQTQFHQGLRVEIDGKKVMFTGDNTWNKRFPQKTRNGPLVPQNEYFLDAGFITCAKRMLEYLPDIVCPAHTDEYSPSREDLEGFLAWAHQLRDVMTDLILQPDPNFGMDYRWCHFYPFRHVAADDREFTVRVLVRNHLFRCGRVELKLKHPAAVHCAEPERRVTVEPKSQAAVPFKMRKVAEYGKRAVVTADVTFNGRRLGEIAEMLVD